MVRKRKYHLPAVSEGMTVKHPLAAGIDVGSRWHAVAIPPHLTPGACRQFGCTSPDLLEMADWLRRYGITTVALESTGNCWVWPFALSLRRWGAELLSRDPRHAACTRRSRSYWAFASSDMETAWAEFSWSHGAKRTAAMASLKAGVRISSMAGAPGMPSARRRADSFTPLPGGLWRDRGPHARSWVYSPFGIAPGVRYRNDTGQTAARRGRRSARV